MFEERTCFEHLSSNKKGFKCNEVKQVQTARCNRNNGFRLSYRLKSRELSVNPSGGLLDDIVEFPALRIRNADFEPAAPQSGASRDAVTAGNVACFDCEADDRAQPLEPPP